MMKCVTQLAQVLDISLKLLFIGKHGVSATGSQMQIRAI